MTPKAGFRLALLLLLLGLKGVQRADVSFRDKEARVTFEPTQVTVNQLIEAVNRSGFRGSLKAGG